MGGSEAIINALIRGLEKHGGRLLLRSHVDQIVMENGRAAGVALRARSPAPTPSNGASNGSSSTSSSGEREFIRARKGVISNASVWDTHKLLPPSVGPREWRRDAVTTPQACDNVFLCIVCICPVMLVSVLIITACVLARQQQCVYYGCSV